LQSLLHAQFALHLHTVYEPKFELELDSQQITDPFVEFREILDDIRKFLASQVVENDTSPERVVLIEPGILDESEPEVVGAIVRSNSFSVHTSGRVYY